MSGGSSAPEQEREEKPPVLPPEFYEELLKRPACKRGKPCVGCGLCEL